MIRLLRDSLEAAAIFTLQSSNKDFTAVIEDDLQRAKAGQGAVESAGFGSKYLSQNQAKSEGREHQHSTGSSPGRLIRTGQPRSGSVLFSGYLLHSYRLHFKRFRLLALGQ